jgi:small subunit ribosomal protein S4
VVTLSSKAIKIPAVKKLLDEKNPTIPSWVERKAAAGKIVRLPKREDIDADINEQLIVEYYSR